MSPEPLSSHPQEPAHHIDAAHEHQHPLAHFCWVFKGREERIFHRFVRALDGSKWGFAARLLQSLPEDDDLRLRLLHTPLTSDGLTAAHLMSAKGAPEPLIKLAMERGADVAAPLGEGPYAGCTPLHFAVLHGQAGVIPALLEFGADVEAVDRSGRTPLAYALEAERSKEHPVATKALLDLGADLRACAELLRGANLRDLDVAQDLSGLDLRGANLIGTDLSESDLRGVRLDEAWFSADTKFPEGYAAPYHLMQKAHDVALDGETHHLSHQELYETFERLVSALPKANQREVLGLLEVEKNLVDACHYCDAYRDAVNEAGYGSGMPLNTLLPKLLYSYPPGQVHRLLRSIEGAMDWFKPPYEYHPNEPELLALCNHPQDPGVTRELIGPLTAAITSIDRWLLQDLHTVVDRRTVYNWGRIGTLTFSFPLWKFDAQSVYRETVQGEREVQLSPLLEQFGFTPLGSRATDFHEKDGKRMHLFGPGFALFPGSAEFSYYSLGFNGVAQKDFDQRAYVEFRRAYLMISHPDHGTLVIRNSSPEFGRDTFPHSAYWSKKGIGNGITQEELIGFDHASLIKHEFSPILSLEINTVYTKLQDHLDVLLDNLDGVRDAFRRWKFDTDIRTAWLDDLAAPAGEGASRLVGAFNSPGFSSVIEFLEKRYERDMLNRMWGRKGAEVPELAIVPPRHIPWVPHTFHDEQEMPQKRLSMNSERLRALRSLADGTFDEEELRDCGVLQFVQMALDTQGELILYSPLKR